MRINKLIRIFAVILAIMFLGGDGIVVSKDHRLPWLRMVPSEAWATSASWGGWGAGNFVHSSSIAGGAGGRVFLDGIVTDRLLQAGTLTSASYMCHTAGTNAFKIKIFRVNGANYDFVGESEKFTPTAGDTLQSHTFSTPITGVHVGDVVGIWIDIDPGAGPEISVAASTGNNVVWAAGDPTGTAVAFGNTVSNFALDLEVFGAQPVAGMTGDSIEVGHGGSFTSFFDGTGPSVGVDGAPLCELGYNMALRSGAFTFVDFAEGSQTFNFVRNTGLPAILTAAGTHCSVACGAGEIWIHCGVNDVATGRMWSAVSADLDAIYSAAGAKPLFIDEILPDSNFNDTLAATIRTFNSNLAAWAVGKATVRIVSCWSAFGQNRVSTGLHDDLLLAYDSGDHVHINATGASVLAGLRIGVRNSYYGIGTRQRRGSGGRSGSRQIGRADISPSILRDIEALGEVLDPLAKYGGSICVR